MRTLPLLAIVASLFFSTTSGQAAQMTSTGFALRGFGMTNGGAASASASFRLRGAVRNESGETSHSTLYAVRYGILPFSGVCGASYNLAFSIAPTADLCSIGTASTVTGNGPWDWICNGLYGGATATCSALPSNWSLSVTIAGSGSGTVNSFTPGFTFSCASGACDKSFPAGTSLTLRASESTDSLLSGWTGACKNVTGDCPVTLDADKAVTATFTTKPPLRIMGAATKYYDTFPLALTGMTDGSSVTLQGRAAAVNGAFNLNRPVNLIFKGGYDAGYGSNTGGDMTILSGGLIIGKGSLTVEKLIIW
jgi:hypothetical protein